jgi:hypothetical protein
MLSPLEGFLTHNRIGDHTGDSLGFFGDFLLGILKLVLLPFLSFCKKFECSGVLVLNTNPPYSA